MGCHGLLSGFLDIFLFPVLRAAQCFHFAMWWRRFSKRLRATEIGLGKVSDELDGNL